MAEFGASACRFEGCSTHDFLPFVCEACGGVFCLEHRSVAAHRCHKAEDFLSRPVGDDLAPLPTPTPTAEDCSGQPGGRKAGHVAGNEGGGLSGGGAGADMAAHSSRHRELAALKPSQVMSAATSRFSGREAELNAEVVHYRVRRTEDTPSHTSTKVGGPDKLLLRAQAAMAKASSTKGKSIAAKVHRMLVTKKAQGDPKVRPEDRFFLEVRYCGNDSAVHYLFFSRTWTVGRMLDEIVSTHKGCVEGMLTSLLTDGDGLEGQVEGLGGSLAPGGETVAAAAGGGGGGKGASGSLADTPLAVMVARTGRQVPLTAMLCALSQEELQPFELVIIAPRVVAEVMAREAEGGMREEERKGEGDGGGAGSGADGGDEQRTREEEEEQGTGVARMAVDATEANEEKEGKQGGNGQGEGEEKEADLELHFSHGKTKFSHSVPSCLTVLELKRELSVRLGVPLAKLKLLYKGMLKGDALPLSSTKLVPGANVIVMGGSK